MSAADKETSASADSQSLPPEMDMLDRVIHADEERSFEMANTVVDVQPRHILLAVEKGVSYGLLQKLTAALDPKHAKDELLKAAWEAAVARGEDKEVLVVKRAQGHV